MRRVRYGVGMSLNGFIADSNGGTAFLVSDSAYDAGPFFASIDTVLMGRVTYEIALRQGFRGYPGLQNYVVSRTLPQSAHPDVTILGDGMEQRVQAMRTASGKDIWLCGGGVLLAALLSAGLVDTIEVGVSPRLVTRPGTPVLATGQRLPPWIDLELARHQVLPSGLLILEYAVKRRPSRRRH